MDAIRSGLWMVLVAMAASGCVTRELAWLVPRATVGFALRTHEGHVAEAGFVTLAAPMQPPVRARQSLHGAGTVSRIHLLGPSPACRVREACRWEGRARSGTFAELAEEEELRLGGGAP